ncbi:MAG: hypothetical protein ABSE96_23215 [Terracidiphilus sp.]|jgi:hypothetical protein
MKSMVRALSTRKQTVMRPHVSRLDDEQDRRKTPGGRKVVKSTSFGAERIEVVLGTDRVIAMCDVQVTATDLGDLDPLSEKGASMSATSQIRTRIKA